MTTKLSAPAVVVLTLAACGNDVEHRNMCVSPTLRRMALEAVQQQIASAGLPQERSFARAFAKLQPVRNEAKVHMIKRTLRIPGLEDLQVCGPDGDETQLTTIIMRRDGDRIGGIVVNFGVPGAQARFGDVDE